MKEFTYKATDGGNWEGLRKAERQRTEQPVNRRK